MAASCFENNKWFYLVIKASIVALFCLDDFNEGNTMKKTILKRVISFILLSCFVFQGAFCEIGPKIVRAETAYSDPYIYDVNDSSVTTWDCVWFGDYPQKEIVPDYEYFTDSNIHESDIVVD